MGYSNFKKLRQVTQRFGLKAQSVTLFDGQVKKVKPSSWLKLSLEIAYIAPPTNEKSKSERLVSPLLLDVYRSYGDSLAFFSGEELNYLGDEDLSGPCDFFFALQPPSPLVQVPIISLAEAKDEDLEWGVAQCAAQMYAAYEFNKQQGNAIPVIYGCATDGIEWQFLKFEDNVFYIDKKPMTEISQILGTWHWILQFFIKSNYQNITHGI